MKKVILVVAILCLMFSVLSCEQKGPAERAGEKIDKTLENLKEKLD